MRIAPSDTGMESAGLDLHQAARQLRCFSPASNRLLPPFAVTSPANYSVLSTRPLLTATVASLLRALLYRRLSPKSSTCRPPCPIVATLRWRSATFVGNTTGRAIGNHRETHRDSAPASQLTPAWSFSALSLLWWRRSARPVGGSY